MNKPISSTAFSGNHRLDVEALVDAAAQAVPPLWPLETAIAVNPLAGLEHLPFANAVIEATKLFGGRGSLPLTAWRRLVKEGAIPSNAVADAAIAALGGIEEAFQPLGADVSQLDLLLARLLELPEADDGSSRASRAGLEADAIIAKWCAAFFAEKAVNLMRNRERGLFAAVLPLLAVDPDVLKLADAKAQAVLNQLDADPRIAIELNLKALEISGDECLPFLRALVARLPGWAGHIRWRTEHAAPQIIVGAPAGMADLIALWTTLARLVPAFRDKAAPQRASAAAPLIALFKLDPELRTLCPRGRHAFEKIAAMSLAELGLVFVKAAERDYRDRLIADLQSAQASVASDHAPRPTAEMVFCIDVRSERLRRNLERTGRIETYGYAGFFGLPVAGRMSAGAPPIARLPVLLKPSHELAQCQQLTGSKRLFESWQGLLNALKDGLATTFTTAEAGGLPAAATMLLRTFAPGLVASARPHANLVNSIPLADQVAYAKSLFTLTGMTAPSARLFVLIGHTGCAINNPYLSALHCGACGGHPGGPNARLLADILNSPQVRTALAAEGTIIPDDTIVIAGEHDTTRDIIELFDLASIPETHQGDLSELARANDEACLRTREIRAVELGRRVQDLRVGAEHWGEVRPEWGLARNAAFIVAPRRLTKHIDLEGRSFLHSYDWRTDSDGSALATILTAPMVVAQWINCQYLFSTLDHRAFGAGDKVTHNVLGGIGVVQGNGGDLRVGLPYQSLFRDDGLPFHLPQRLLTIVHAPTEMINSVIDAEPALQRLFDNGWVTLVSFDPVSGEPKLYLPENSRSSL